MTDKQGSPVTGLQAKDIRIQDQGTAATILSLTSEAEAPFRLVVLVDISGSMRECQGCKPAVLRTAAMLQLLLRSGTDKAALFAFGPDTYLLRAYSDDLSSWKDAISELKPGGGSRLFDALTVVSGRISRQREQEPLARFAVLLLTDGNDNASDASREQALASLLRNRVTVYSVRIGGFGRTTEETLRQFATKSGGLSFLPRKVKDLEQAVETVVTDVRSRYRVEYRPVGAPSDALRNLKVTAVQGMRVRSAAGYYAAAGAGAFGAKQQPQPTVDGGTVFVSTAEMQHYVASQVPPEYPSPISRRRETGTVVMRITVSPDGLVEKVTPLSGPEGLVPAAVEAVRRWRYRPYLRDKVAVQVETEVSVDFRVGH